MGGTFLKARRNGREYFYASPVFSFDGTRSGSGNGYADFFSACRFRSRRTPFCKASRVRLSLHSSLKTTGKSSRKLTVNLGVRWEPYLPLSETNNRLTRVPPGPAVDHVSDRAHGPGVSGRCRYTRHHRSERMEQISPRGRLRLGSVRQRKNQHSWGYGIFYDTPRLVPYNSYPPRQPFSVGTTLSNPYSLSDPYRGAQNIPNALLAYVGGVPAGQATYQFVTSCRRSAISILDSPTATCSSGTSTCSANCSGRSLC